MEMSPDVTVLTEFAVAEIRAFAETHPQETFCAFAIDGEQLCFNTDAWFEKKLSYYIESASEEFRAFYRTDEFRQQLWRATGDWKYQGFAELTDSVGLERSLLYDYLDSSPTDQRESEFARMMSDVLERLEQRYMFGCLRRSSSFNAFLVHRAENS